MDVRTTFEGFAEAAGETRTTRWSRSNTESTFSDPPPPRSPHGSPPPPAPSPHFDDTPQVECLYISMCLYLCQWFHWPLSERCLEIETNVDFCVVGYWGGHCGGTNCGGSPNAVSALGILDENSNATLCTELNLKCFFSTFHDINEYFIFLIQKLFCLQRDHRFWG